MSDNDLEDDDLYETDVSMMAVSVYSEVNIIRALQLQNNSTGDMASSWGPIW